LQRACELDPKDSSLKTELKEVNNFEKIIESARSLEKSGNLAASLQYYESALNVSSEAYEPRIKQIELLAKLGRTKEAVEKSKKHIGELAHSPEFLYARGLALYYDDQL
jgi:tetratricopeptide (TPR) repeat protein